MNLIKNKKVKRRDLEKIKKNKKKEESNFIFDDNIDDLLENNENKEKKADSNYDREEEIRLLKEVEELSFNFRWKKVYFIWNGNFKKFNNFTNKYK